MRKYKLISALAEETAKKDVYKRQALGRGQFQRTAKGGILGHLTHRPDGGFIVNGNAVLGGVAGVGRSGGADVYKRQSSSCPAPCLILSALLDACSSWLTAS